ncbi:phosphonate metabolism protein PhnM [Notoacmeibacter marinus]|uniref:Phosphonate metabolism protein PhnM n=1 Tax=Notoacmeibacter marinus TaxID=1876515 RepID=A0A231V1M0_9HYPH|nr:alpha-D-ribose 1-methylphosphonate 5-triphosphate diphosphatase [Notoacmeibacter marinus]OXT02095.1 phosphonate metabolism protein PhnM [Notoacmeibacter marinus]
MTGEQIYTNAAIIRRDAVVHGTLVVRDGAIAEIAEGRSEKGIDCEGDYLLPGLIELHTDHLEGHYSPRPGVRWDRTAAIQAHDAQVAASGITTVFDCLRLGSDEEGGFEVGEMRAMADALKGAQTDGRLRADHHIHLRCEVSAPDVLDHFEPFQHEAMVRLASLMDHAPGQRQFQTMEQYILYYKTKKGMSDDAFDRFVEKRRHNSATHADRHRRILAERCAERNITLASHDDATAEHVAEACDLGTRLAEFPTSLEAARSSHETGMSVLMGAPNVVRGKSHSGNIAATDLADAGVLDVLSSDYVPISLITAPFVLHDRGMALSDAIALVTATPARAVSLDDRGEMQPGKRADFIRVRRTGEGDMPLVRSVWRQGARVA